MCGRYTLHTDPKKLADYFSATLKDGFELSYNIAPTRVIAALIAIDNERMIIPLRWGLIPSWHKADTKLPLLINAKSETIDTKPSFRQAFRQHRCLILADGFYEWDAKENPKQPYYIHMESHTPFGMAGVWERWISNENIVDSCCIITMPANPKLATIHDRMPAVILPDKYDAWLDNSMNDVSELKHIIEEASPSDIFETYRVSTRVNATKNNDSNLIKPV